MKSEASPRTGARAEMGGPGGAGSVLPHFPSVVTAEAALSKNKLSWFVDLNLRIYVEAVEKSGT